MTATSPDPLLEDLEVGRTHQVSADDDPSGQVRWQAFVYDILDTETATELDVIGDFPVWDQIATRLTGAPADGGYRAAALAWLAEVAGPGACRDCVLVLPDVVERVRSS